MLAWPLRHERFNGRMRRAVRLIVCLLSFLRRDLRSRCYTALPSSCLIRCRRCRASGAPQDSNRSQSAIEPVSVRGANSCRETVWRGQRPRPHFWRRLHILRNRDWPPSRVRRQSPGKLRTIPKAAGNEICAGLRGGAGRTQTSNQPIMGPKVIISGCRRTLGPTIGRQDCGPIDRAPPAQAPSRWRRADRSRQ
jgi:hypothetical protein